MCISCYTKNSPCCLSPSSFYIILISEFGNIFNVLSDCCTIRANSADSQSPSRGPPPLRSWSSSSPGRRPCGPPAAAPSRPPRRRWLAWLGGERRWQCPCAFAEHPPLSCRESACAQKKHARCLEPPPEKYASKAPATAGTFFERFRAESHARWHGYFGPFTPQTVEIVRFSKLVWPPLTYIRQS